eukprot:1196126-Prorocentrum_minimum.AAC.1
MQKCITCSNLRLGVWVVFACPDGDFVSGAGEVQLVTPVAEVAPKVIKSAAQDAVRLPPGPLKPAPRPITTPRAPQGGQSKRVTA